MQDFIFQNKTKIYFGKDQLGHLGEEISRFGKKVLLVYGGGSIKKIGLYDKVMKELEKAGMSAAGLYHKVRQITNQHRHFVLRWRC